MRFVKRRGGALSLVLAGLLVSCTSTDGFTDGGDAPLDGGSDAPNADAPTSTDGGGTDTGSTVDKDCQTYAMAFCARLIACTPALVTQSYGGPTTCTDRETVACVHYAGLPGSRFPKSLAQCADDVAKMSCAAVVNRAYPSSCLVPGDLQNGAACVAPAQCASTYCGAIDEKQCGTCAPLAQLDGACTEDFGCATGLRCQNQKCAKAAALGESCQTAPCSADLHCDQQQLKCVAKKQLNEACDPAQVPCDSFQSLSCPNNVCTKLGYVEPGQICGNNLGCSGGMCRPNPPSTTPICTAWAKLGEACGMTQCLTPGRCIAGQCALPLPAFCVK